MRVKFFIKDIGAIISPDYVLRDTQLSKYQCDFNLSKIPLLERRRLGNASKCLFSVLDNFDLSNKPMIVFSSFYGEINRCFEMLYSLKDSDFISPSAFSLSVLNATPAILAINTQNHCEISAISGNPSLEYGIINAIIKMQETNKDVLVVSYYEKINLKDLKHFPYYLVALYLRNPNNKNCDFSEIYSELEYYPNPHYKNDFIECCSDLDFLFYSNQIEDSMQIENSVQIEDSVQTQDSSRIKDSVAWQIEDSLIWKWNLRKIRGENADS